MNSQHSGNVLRWREGGALSAALACCLPRQRAESRTGMKAVRVRLRVTARGCVAVTMRTAIKGPKSVALGPKHWGDELLKLRLNAIRKAVRSIELAECNRSVDTAESEGSDGESWHSCVSDSEEG